MKEHISVEDLKGLSDSQKEALRFAWVPEKNDLVLASICMNVETEEYDDIEFVVGEIVLNENTRTPHIVLRRFKLLDNNTEEDEGEFDEQELVEIGDMEDENSFEMVYCEPEQYFNKEDCLPLLNIGQLIHFLRRSKFGQNGFKVFIPPEDIKLFDTPFSIEDRDGETYENEELCDLLWDSLKTVL